MIRALAIVPDRELRDGLVNPPPGETRTALQSVRIHQTIPAYPSEDDLRRALDVLQPQVVFFDAAGDLDEILTAARLVHEHPGVFLVGLLHTCESRILIRLMQAGIREVWQAPYDAATVRESLMRVDAALRSEFDSTRKTPRVYAFLPAKTGSGATTIAVNTALALGRLEQRRVLLADLDLQDGTVKFLLKLNSAFSAVDALEKVTELDESLWSELVTQTSTIDVLTSGSVAHRMVYSTGRARRLIEFLRSNYATALIDLAGRLDDLAVEALQECSRILVVCAPDLPTLFLAREKVRYLEDAGLLERVTLILNRWSKQAPVTIADVESLLGLPVQQSIREDTAEIGQAILKGTGVAPLSPLGDEYALLAQALSEAPAPRSASPKKRMVDYFVLSPGGYSLQR